MEPSEATHGLRETHSGRMDRYKIIMPSKKTTALDGHKFTGQLADHQAVEEKTTHAATIIFPHRRHPIDAS